MFLISIQINRQPSMGGFYFLYFLFFLNICTAYLPIMSAFNHDKEEIIQLSMESIHVVKSAESQMTNFEEHIYDDEEKDLLSALLTFYDDEVNIDQQIINEIPATNTSLLIRLIPFLLHFSEQSIAIPRMQTVMIINEESEPLELYSLIGTTNEFYSSFSKQTILLPYGGNISINIYYLPRTIGLTKSIFTIKTNRGNFSYDVSGIGISNPYRLRPLINIEIPLNSTFEYTIQFYNPYNYSLNINEIYTSDENLIIELLSNKNLKNRLTKSFQYHEQWYLKPYETKSIIKINYFAYKLNQLNAFICIKTNFSEKIILPVEINVLNRSGLYSNVDLLEFTSERFIRSVIESIKIPVYVFNYGSDPVIITDVRVTSEHENYMTIRYKNLLIPPDIYRLNQIADITIHPNLIPNDIEHIHGYIQVYTSTSPEEPVLQIPFDETILHGSLDFNKEETYFYISNNQQIDQCQSIKLLNRYNTPISVYNITINKFELLSKYTQIKYPSSFFYLYPDQWNELLCLTLLQQSSSFAAFHNIQTTIDVHTNLSHFYFPIHLYNGFLDLDLINDQTNGGIKYNENNPLELFLTSIPVNTSRTVRFVLTNSNPIDIRIEKFEFTLLNTDIQLDYMKLLDGNETKIRIEDSDISQIVIPQQHQAVFLLTIQGIDPPKLYSESINIKTNYQNLHINVNYEIINGSVEFVNKTPLHIDVFPNRPGSVEIFVMNKFDEPINVTRVDFITYGLCFSFTWSNTSIDRVILQPNKTEKIGRVHFDMIPLCKSIRPPSESTCYCGLNHHSQFKQHWDESVSVLNTYELDHRLVTKFRNLWKEWRSLVRKQQIETNIWLYTNRANISWPITIGFIWPSVLEQMSSGVSSTPIILDFQVIAINITKTQNVIITNPSSDLLTYSVELFNNDSFLNDQIFTISTTSTRVELKNNSYTFNLFPNEQITFSVSYRPSFSIKHEMYFIVRNSLTIMESILLRGEGGVGSLQIGNRQPGSSSIPIVLEINENQYELCSNPNGNPVLQKIVKLHNTGNLKTIIYDIGFGDWRCFGRGFSVPICQNIEIEPDEKYDFPILFQPDYTSDEINETLLLNTNIGLITIPISVRIPQGILSACYQTIARPPWELRPYCLCLCSLLVLIIFLFTFAVFDARRLFDHYLTRAEWRNRIQTTNNQMFDLTDLSSAIQDEQKPRERIESNQIHDVKKEKTIEIKHKRLSNRNSDESNISGRSAAVNNPKEIPQKVRRATADYGPSKFAKQQVEPVIKSQPLRRQKSEQNPPPNPTRPVSSSTVSEEENEPFVVARSKRTLSKRKGSFTNNPPKPTTDNTPPVIRKSSLHSTEQDFDPINDQQWHMVSSNKSQRKGTVSRRETTDESQITNKTPKVSSADSEKPMILTSSSRTYSSVSHESRQARRHNHPTQNPSPPSVPILTKRQSLQDNTSLIVANREVAFRQLTEELWAAGLPSSTTACSMSIRSRCSSAPPSERGGGDDEATKTDGHNDNEEETIDWDEPDVPDEDFSGYVPQTEYSMDEANGLNEPIQIQQKSTIPPLMSLSITPPPIVTTNLQQKPTISPSVIKENIEPLPFLPHAPGPIQRPNKLPCSPTTQSSTSFFHDSTLTPNTPDVLIQINHLVDRQNSISITPSTVSNLTNTSTIINDITTPNVSWTPFSPPEWSSKYESTWPLTTQTQNPFAQRQISKDESALWSEPTINTAWLKFTSVSDASSSNRQENETNIPFWNPINIHGTPPNSSTPWWPKTPSDENNNDHSRWDFAR